MLTTHLLIKNNQETISKTLESIIALKPKILIGDMGSTDATISICRKFGAKIHKFNDRSRCEARNELLKYAEGINLWIEPWEILIQGHNLLANFQKDCSYVSVLHDKIISKEVRIWAKNQVFINPVFERLNVETEDETNIIVYSNGSSDNLYIIDLLDKWILSNPLTPDPYYYKACVLLSWGKYDDFIKLAEHYLFLDKTNSQSAIMTRYYYSMVQILYTKKARPALQNLNLCLCERPLMAEFWCLMADVYYHLLHKFDQAKEFYENALILGSKRLKTDKWPMDITKYSSYPKKMIESCDIILKSKSFYGVSREQS